MNETMKKKNKLTLTVNTISVISTVATLILLLCTWVPGLYCLIPPLQSFLIHNKLLSLIMCYLIGLSAIMSGVYYCRKIKNKKTKIISLVSSVYTSLLCIAYGHLNIICGGTVFGEFPPWKQYVKFSGMGFYVATIFLTITLSVISSIAIHMRTRRKP